MIEVSEPVTARPAADAPQPARRSAPRMARALRRTRRLSLAALVIGLAATAALSWASFVINEHSESRLLALQTKQAATVLQVIIPALQTPLSSAAEIAATSDGDPARFRGYMSGYVGAKGNFVSASLWRVDAGRPSWSPSPAPPRNWPASRVGRRRSSPEPRRPRRST